MRIWFTTLLIMALMVSALPLSAETLVNWENGFEVEVPATWLRNEGKQAGLKLNSEDVRIKIEPYSGVDQAGQIERLHKMYKAKEYEFKAERDLVIHEVPTHEMVFFKDGKYRIFYVMMSGDRGFLWTVDSESTDSEAFEEGQGILESFRVTPRRTR